MFRKNFIKMKGFIKRVAVFLLVVGVYYLLTWKIGCPIKYITGISCPGCGMTRAWFAVLRFDFKTAFEMHPLFVVMPIMVCAILYEDKIYESRLRYVVAVIVILMCTVYILRQIYDPGDVVCFSPENGLIGKLFLDIMTKIVGSR